MAIPEASPNLPSKELKVKAGTGIPRREARCVSPSPRLRLDGAGACGRMACLSAPAHRVLRGIVNLARFQETRMGNRRFVRFAVVVQCLLVFLGACAKEKPDPPKRLNPLDPATELNEPDPFHLVAEIVEGGVLIRWQPVDMSELAGWIVLRSDDGAFDPPDTLAVLEIAVTSLLDPEPVPGRRYYYKVLAVDGQGRASAGSHLAAAEIETYPIFLIDGDSTYAESRRVTLTIQATEADSMWIANDSTFSGASAVPFQSEIADWLLEPGPGQKTVYLRILYTDGRFSPVVADSIDAEPIGERSVRSREGTPYVASLACTLIVRARGVDSVKVWNLGNPAPTAWTRFPSSSDTMHLEWAFPGGEGWKDLVAAYKNDFLVEAGPETVSVAVDLTSPSAVFSLSPPDTARCFVSDASGSYDHLDVTPRDELLVSWQWEGGSAWTPWSTAKSATHTFLTYGLKTIRLVVKDGAGRTDTLAHEVSCANRPPTVPANPWPEDGEPGVSLLPRLSWSPSEDPDQDPVTYTIYFGTVPDPDAVLVSGWPATPSAAPPLEAGVTYHWTVVALDSLGAESEPGHWSFTTRSPSTETYPLAVILGSQGSGAGEFEVVRDVAVDFRGRVYASDVNNRRVQVFFPPRFFFDEITEADGVAFSGPYGLATDAEASLYVADMNNHRVVKFDSSLQFVRSLGSKGKADGEFRFPRDVCADREGNLYVLDTGNDRVQKFDRNGSFLLKWGSKGAADGQFDTPSGLAEAQDSIYVADSFNRRVQKFTSDGQFCSSWGGFGETGLPRAVAADSAGHLFVVDSAGGMVYKFTTDGVLLSNWDAATEYENPEPEGLWVDRQGNLVWIADTYNHRLMVYERQ